MESDEARSELEVRLLGPLEVSLAGQRVRIGSPKQRAALALLALQAGRVVSCDTLCGLLWEKEQPTSPPATLQSLISRLRRTLANASGGLVDVGQVLRTREPGWVLDENWAAVDALRFQELTASARRRSGRGEGAEAAADLAEAVGLWRGAALADVVDAGYLATQATRLNEARLDAVEDLADAELATGRPGEALALLEGHVDAHPLRERGWGLLMVALYRLGRQAAALRAFQQARAFLGEELGLEPSPELTEMEARVLRHDPTLAGPSRSGSASTPWGATPQSRATKPTRSPPQVQIAEGPEALLEREQDIAALQALVYGALAGDARVGLIEGPAGIGKSRLLIEARRRATSAGMRVLPARGGERESELPFGVVRQLFEPVLAEDDESLFTGAAEAARRVLEVGGEHDADAESSFAALHALYWLTVNLSGRSPLALAIDDLQWCDPPSLRFLAYLLRRLEGLPVLVLLGQRDTQPSVDTALTDEIARDPLTVLIRPRPLSEDAVSALMRERLGPDAAATLSASSHAATGGNPLLLDEVLRALAVDAVRPPVAPHGIRLVGRAAELCRVRAALDRAATGRGGVVLVSGEPGVGKTRLVEELTYHAARVRAIVAWGSCHPGGSAPPFWPWSQALRSMVAEVQTPAGDHDMAAVAQLVPELKGAAPAVGQAPVDPAHARFQLCQGIAGFIERAASSRLLVVVLDDLHWADGPSVELFSAVVSRLAGSRLLLVGTYRDVEVRQNAALVDALATLARVPTVDRLVLVGMTEDDCGRFISSVIGAEPSPEFVHAVQSRTDGNPFYVGELLRLLQEDGSLTHADPGAALRSPVPVGVRDVINQRFGRLSERSRHLLTIAAVAGREFDQQLLDFAGGVSEEESLAAVELALSHGLIAETDEAVGHYRFSHGLIRDTIYAGISGLRRARVHARVGEALEALPDDGDLNRAAVLAHHFAQAAPVGGAEKAFRYAIAAADAAADQLAYESAEEHLRRAVRMVPTLSPSERRRAELRALARLGALLAAIRGQAASEVRTVFKRASELCLHGDCSRDAITAHWGYFYSCYVRGELGAALAVAREMLTPAPTGAAQELVMGGHLAMGIACFHTGQLAEARDHLLAEIEIADRLADPSLASVFQVDPRVYARCFFALVLALTGESDRAEETARGARRLAAAERQPFTITTAAMFSAWLGFLRGDPASASEHGAATAAMADEQGFPLLASAGRAFEGWALARSGALDAAAVQMEKGLAAFRSGGGALRQPLFVALEAEVAHLGGSAERALALLDEALAASLPGEGQHYFDAALHRLRAEILLDGFPERAEAARDSLLRAVAIARAQGAELLRRRAEGHLEAVGHCVRAP